MRLIAAVFVLSFALPAQALVFFSEYVEGSANNKALELFNSDTLPFDLSAAGCEILIYANGNPSPLPPVNLNGSVPPLGVFVLANSSADPLVLAQANQTSGSLSYNGDDAVELRCQGTTFDAIGQIGVDPGSEWGSGDTSTQNNTIRRKVDACAPDNDGSDPFDPLIDWDGFPNNDFTDLGTHSNNCGEPVVFISEYVEGSSFNKSIELYNDGATAFDLTGGDCSLNGYQNGGSTIGWDVDLTGSVPPQGTFVISNTQASQDILNVTDQTGSVDFNGDDAVEFACGGASVDVIGQIGFDPGSEWGTGDTSTQNNTIRRKITVCAPDPIGNDAFDPAIEWNGFPNNNIDDLGNHTVDCGSDTTPPTISSVTPSTTGPTPLTTIGFTVVFSEAVTDFDDAGDVTVNTTGTAFSNLNFVDNSPNSVTLFVEGISGTGTLSLTVNSASVVDLAGNPNSDTLTSADVQIDPNSGGDLPVGLLLSEIVVAPFDDQFVEIINTSAETIDLSDVYLTDATFSNGNVFYYQIVQGAGGGGGFFDFHARFPDGATIAAGERQTIALDGSTNFETAYGISPTYELFEDGAPDGIPDLREAFPGSINGQG
ncbi:MAG: hypothetical protein AAGJ52_03935, partial [Pseudomonadota bacterium]